MHDIMALVMVSKLEQEQRIKEAARWNRAVEVGNAQPAQRSNRRFGRKRSA